MNGALSLSLSLSRRAAHGSAYYERALVGELKETGDFFLGEGRSSRRLRSTDVLLLLNFIASQKRSLSLDESWTPVCLGVSPQAQI